MQTFDVSPWTVRPSVAPKVKVALAGAPNISAFQTFLSNTSDHPLSFAVNAVENAFVSRSNPYDLYLYMLENDSNLQAAVEIKAGLVASAYKGVMINADGELDKRESYILKVARKYADDVLRLKSMYYQIAMKLCVFGNCVFVKLNRTKSGYPKLQYLPITHLTILQRRGQLIQQSTDQYNQVWVPNYYVLNEQMDWDVTKDGEPTVFAADQIVHVQLNEGFDQVEDAMGRYTQGVWSRSPFKAVVQTWWWKQEIIWGDMLAREQMMPVQHHQIDVDWIAEMNPAPPSGWTKTQVEWVMELQNQVLKNYEDMLANRKPDQPLISSNKVSVDIRESKATSYMQANDVIDQLDSKHAIALGIPISIVSSDSSSFASDVIRTSHATVTTDRYIEVISHAMLDYLKEVLLERYPSYSKQIKSLRINHQLSLDKDQDMMMRRAAVGDSMKIFHPDELRTMAGFPNILPDKMKAERESFYLWREELGKQPADGGNKIGSSGSSANIRGQSTRRNPQTLDRPDTSQSKLQRQNTI